MPRKRPEPSEELVYLRKVIGQTEEADDPADVQLKFYRNLMKKDDKFVLQQKIAAEEKFRAEVAAWQKEGKKEKGIANDDAPLEPCEQLVRRLIQQCVEE